MRTWRSACLLALAVLAGCQGAIDSRAKIVRVTASGLQTSGTDSVSSCVGGVLDTQKKTITVEIVHVPRGLKGPNRSEKRTWTLTDEQVTNLRDGFSLQIDDDTGGHVARCSAHTIQVYPPEPAANAGPEDADGGVVKALTGTVWRRRDTTAGWTEEWVLFFEDEGRFVMVTGGVDSRAAQPADDVVLARNFLHVGTWRALDGKREPTHRGKISIEYARPKGEFPERDVRAYLLAKKLEVTRLGTAPINPAASPYGMYEAVSPPMAQKYRATAALLEEKR